MRMLWAILQDLAAKTCYFEWLTFHIN